MDMLEGTLIRVLRKGPGSQVREVLWIRGVLWLALCMAQVLVSVCEVRVWRLLCRKPV